MQTNLRIGINSFTATAVATTQEENHNQIVNKWNLYQTLVTDGEDIKTYVGRLIEYTNNEYAVFPEAGFQRYEIHYSQIQFFFN